MIEIGITKHMLNKNGGNFMETLLFVNLRSYKVERIKPILVAKKLGYRVAVMADNNPNLLENLIDDLIITNTYDFENAIEEVKKYNKSHPISGVMTWSDKDVELVAHLNNVLGTAGIDLDIVINARNKYHMRENFKNIPNISAKFERVYGFNDLEKAVKEIGTPGILKPVGASGSKGIFKIESKDNLEKIYESLIKSTSPKDDLAYSYYPNEYIYEEFLDGEEVSVEGLVQNNEVFIAGITDKNVTEEFSLEYFEIFPSEKDDETKKEIKDKATLAIKSLKINNCAFHLEGRVTTNGFKVIEAAARPGGGFIASHMLEISSGSSFIEKVIDVAVGNDIKESWKPFDLNNRRVGYYNLIPEKEGSLLNISGIDKALEISGLKYIIPLKNYGDKIIFPPKSFSSSFLLTILIEGEGSEDIKNKFQKIKNVISYKIE